MGEEPRVQGSAEDARPDSRKRPYTRPRLVVHGHVAALTGGAGKSGTDAGIGTSMS